MLPKPRIHFLENFGNVWQLPNSNEWESGYWWRVGKANANALIGGHIYLHTAKAAPSHHGGIITGYPMFVHRDFIDPVFTEIRKLGGEKEVNRWQRKFEFMKIRGTSTQPSR